MHSISEPILKIHLIFFLVSEKDDATTWTNPPKYGNGNNFFRGGYPRSIKNLLGRCFKGLSWKPV